MGSSGGAERIVENGWFLGSLFSFLFFCGEGLSEIILCSRISWLCLKPLFLVHLSTKYMKTNEIYFKNHCYFGFSQLPCLYKQLRINSSLSNLCSDSGADGDVW